MRKTIFKSIILALVFSFLIFNVTYSGDNLKKVNAGASKNYVLSGISVSGDSLNLGDFLTDGGIYVKNSKIRFDKEQVKNSSYVIAATKINNLYECGLDILFTSEMKIAINDIVKESGKVEIIYGMNSVRNVADGKDLIKMVFTKDSENRLNMAIVEVFEGDREPHYIIETSYMPVVSFEEQFDLYITAKTDNSISIKINNTEILKNYRTNIDLTGYFAIYSEGKNDLSVSETEILAYTYIVAKNADYLETFDNGEYNANMFYSSALALDYTPCRLSVNEDGMLEFLNTHEAYFCTKYKYSNYELEFDLIDLVTKNVVDENGKIVKPLTGRIGIGSGENYKGTVPAFEHSDIWLLLWGDRPAGAIFEMLDHFEARKIVSMGSFNLWDEKFIDGRDVKVKYTSTDGLIKLYLKFLGEFDDVKYKGQEKYYDYQCYFECDTGKSEEGCVKIFSYGNANYKIDNLSIKNTDYVGVRQSMDKESVGFTSNRHEKTPDYNYTDKSDANDLLKQQLESGKKMEVKESAGGCSASFGGGFALLLPISLCALSLRRKRR